jgi:uridine monophosphate synthetase
MTDHELILSLYHIGVFKFGSFKLKSGKISKFYIDLRMVISYPSILAEVCKVFAKRLPHDTSLLCGVPYAAVPLVTGISLQTGIPMINCRKDIKPYGTTKDIEGVYTKDQDVVLIEDIITSGASIMETAERLKHNRLTITKVVVFIDREEGGMKFIKDHNLEITSCFTMSRIIKVLSSLNTTWKSRELACKNKIGKKLFRIIQDKQTTLCVSADVTTKKELLNLIHNVGSYICVLKIHIDIIKDAVDYSEVVNLSTLYNFLIFEDRKFADIGNTVINQYSGGIFNIQSWSNIVNAHVISGPGIIDALRSVSSDNNSLLLIAEMSTKDNLFTPDYTKRVVEMAESNTDFVIGFISQHKLSEDPGLLHFTPGIRLEKSDDSNDQQYNTIEHAIEKCGSDIIIVGRGILNDISKIEEYRTRAWNAKKMI